MGIVGLMKLIYEECPEAVKEHNDMENLTGRKVAIDASMALYQFLVAVRTQGQAGGAAAMQLTNAQGEVTSHIQGMFNRTIKMMTSGIKPLYVFDGKPPQMKGDELAKRIAKRAKAEKDLKAATEAGETDEMDKYSRRLVKVTRQHNEDCKQLLTLMGVPYVDAPCEAEAQCAELAKKNKVYATATEDMDALTFRTPKLLRRLTFSQGKDKQAILEIDCETVLKGMQLTYEQFVDLCILCGCDYSDTIKGIGPKTALKLIRMHKSIENILAALRKDKKHRQNIPESWKPKKVSKAEVLEDERRQKEEEEARARLKEEAEKAALSSGDAIASGFSLPDSEAKSVPISSETHMDPSSSSSTSEPTSSSTIATDVSTTNASNPAVIGNDDEDDGVGFVEEEEAMVAESNDDTFDEVAEVGGDNTDDGIDDGNDDAVVIKDDENPDDFVIIPPLYAQARELFVNADVKKAEEVELKWTEPNEDGLRAFLVDKMGFDLNRVNSAIKRLQEAQKNKSQKRMDSFFAPVASSSSSSSGIKRKVEEVKGKGASNKAQKGPAGKAMGKKR